MLMPFSSAFLVANLGIDLHHLPTVYLVTGLATIFVGPLIGKAADKVGKFRVFVFGTGLSIVMVLIYTHLGVTPLPLVVLVNVCAVRGHLLAHDSVSGAVLGCAGCKSARLIQRNQRIDTAIVRRPGFGRRRPHCLDRRRRQAAQL